MKLRRRQFPHLAAGAVVLPASVRAQAYPSRPIRMIVGQAAGSATDIVGRLVANFLSENSASSSSSRRGPEPPATWKPCPHAARWVLADGDKLAERHQHGALRWHRPSPVSTRQPLRAKMEMMYSMVRAAVTCRSPGLGRLAPSAGAV